jgi:uncharacterized cupin superfamily protein
MRKVNVKDVEWQDRHSPKAKFGRRSKNISITLGRDPESLDLMKRHPFDLALVSIPKGKSLCPYHSHSSESELYLVVSGRGSIRDKDGSTIVITGDAFFFAPGEAHQLTNASEEDFVYYVIADNPRGDSCHYPDSGKFAVWKEGMDEVIVKGKETDYFDGEEQRDAAPN